MSAQQQIAYFDIYDRYFRPQQSFKVAWYAINEADHSDIWNELNWCSYQPWSRSSAPYGYCAVAVAFRPDFRSAKCVQKVPCHFNGFPMCVYDPNAPTDRMVVDFEYPVEYNAEETDLTEDEMEAWKTP